MLYNIIMSGQLPFSIENFKGGKPKRRSRTPKRSARRSPKKNRSGKKGKKGGNFLGVVSELLFPTGFEHAATTAGLVGLDAFSKKRSASKKDKRGGAKKSKSRSARKVRKSKSRSARKARKVRKSKSRSARKVRKSKSKSKGKKSRKGGDFLSAAASIVAPTGFETLATAAGLTGLARGTSGRRLRNRSNRRSRSPRR